MQLGKSSVIGFASVGLLGLGVYQYLKNKNQEEEVKTAGGGGSSTTYTSDNVKKKITSDNVKKKISNNDTSDVASNADLGATSQSESSSLPDKVVKDAKAFARAQNREGNDVSFSYNSGTKRTDVKNSSGDTVAIFDYKKKISTTPKLERNSSSSSSGSSKIKEKAKKTASQARVLSDMGIGPISSQKKKKKISGTIGGVKLW